MPPATKTLVHALALAALLGPAALSQAHAQGDALASALSQVRQRGCGGQPGRAAFRPVAQLNQAAERIARGQRGVEALQQAGYRYTRMYQVQLTGARSAGAAADLMAQRYCPQLADPGLTELGVHQRGQAWWVVLAAPFMPPAPSAAGEVAARALQLVNQARAQPRQCGNRAFQAAPPLRYHPLLDQAALAHARDMATHSFMAHEGRDGSSFDARISRAGYRWRSVAENVAAGQPSADEVVRDWLRSPGHCANLMNPAFTEMGLAFATNPRSADGIYWAQTFGRPR